MTSPEIPAQVNVTARYAAMFDRLRQQHDGAFVPFFVVGDPDLETSAALLRAAVRAGADALEVGIPFSDPIADGPTLQRANLRAAAAGATPRACFEVLAAFRAEFPGMPVGLLTYANLVVHGGVDAFYERVATAGVDSVLIADVPLLEAEPYALAARAHGVAPVLLAPPNLPHERLARIAALSSGYTYCVARKGVTGVNAGELGGGASGQGGAVAGSTANDAHAPTSAGGDGTTALYAALRAAGAPPPLLGFGISTPADVRAAIAAGAAGAICGSAVAQLIEANMAGRAGALSSFIRAMKEATLGALPR